jgi:hypothetical protein
MKTLFLALCFLGAAFTAFGASQGSPDPYYFSNYREMDLEFLRSHYTEINNGRAIQIDARFLDFKWKSPFQYQEALNLDGLDVNRYHVLQFTLKEKDDFHYPLYVFPVFLFPVHAGDLEDLQGLSSNQRIAVYGRFYNLKNSEFAIAVDVIETINKGGHDRTVLLDTRLAPTPTPADIPTPTPGPGIWKRLKSMMNPTPTPTGTVTTESK